MAVVVEHDLLRTLHRLHRQKKDLESRIERGPRQLKASVKKVDEITAAIDELKESYKRTQVLANEKQLLLKQREEKILDFKGKLNAAKSNEEFQAFKNQIAADEQANDVQSDEIFEQLEKIDEINSKIADQNEKLQKAVGERDKVQDKIDAEAAGLKSELERVVIELAESEAKIPIDIKTDYVRVAKSKGEGALAPLDGDFCGNCFKKITMMQHSDLAAQKPVACKECGAFIYLPENTRVG